MLADSAGDIEEIEGVWQNGVREGDFVRTTSWGRIVYEKCSGGHRTAFSLGQHVVCPGHVAMAVQERASPQKIADAGVRA